MPLRLAKERCKEVADPPRPLGSVRRQACSLEGTKRWTRLVALLLAYVTLGHVPARAMAQDLETPPTRTEELPYSLPVDLSITGVALSVTLVTELAKGKLAPIHCRWCNPNGFDRRVRDALVVDDTNAARKASNWVAIGAVPLAAGLSLAAFAFRDGTPHNFWVDLLIVAEAVAVTSTLTQIVKLTTGRQRPFVHFTPEDEQASLARVTDHNMSFFSAHTSLVFSLVTAAGMTAHMRNYRHAYVIWALGLPLAGLTGYLRMAADRHYFTDVLAGAAVGSAVGTLMPWLLHRPRTRAWPQLSFSTEPAQILLTFSR
jgi:membrane-associated phospholipid phosphatase